MAWQKTNDISIKKTSESTLDSFARLKHNTQSCNVKTEISFLNRGDRKFPQLGDENIVGQMVQVATELHCMPHKELPSWRLLAEKFFRKF
jgi:hypothetical protein